MRDTNENEMQEINDRLDRIEHALTVLIKYSIYGEHEIDSFERASSLFQVNTKHNNCVNKAKRISEQAGGNRQFIDAFLKTAQSKE